MKTLFVLREFVARNYQVQFSRVHFPFGQLVLLGLVVGRDPKGSEENRVVKGK